MAQVDSQAPIRAPCSTNMLPIVFYRYFQEQNELVRKGTASGVPLALKTLGIGNGIIDAVTQFPSVRSRGLPAK
jgi:hypothetical protein